MKQFVDQKGNLINFGELVHYTERINEKGYTSFCEIHTTLTPKNVEALKAIGAIKEVEVEVTLEHYENKLSALLLSDESKKSFNRFKVLFPAQYLSAIITLINDDIDDEKNISDTGFIFNLGTGKFDEIKTNIPLHYINIFSSKKTKDLCEHIIKPLVDKMYK